MTRNEFIEYATLTYSVEPDHPFADEPTITVFRHSENRKWFAVVMTVEKNRLGIESDEPVDIVNMKCDPDMKYSFINGVSVLPAYHMNKRHWITAVLDGSEDDDKIRWLLDVSYHLTGIKRKKKCRD